MRTEKKRIFLGSQEVSGMMSRLNNAFHEMGIESDFYCMMSNLFFSEKENMDLPVLRKYQIHTNKIDRAASEREKSFWSFFQMLDILHVFFRMLFRYDKFIFIFGHGVFYYNKYLKKIEELEFFLLKMFRKKMVMWLCGSDSRPPYCNGATYWIKDWRLRLETQDRMQRVRMLEKYMKLIDVPASSHFHSKPYLIFNCIGVPIDESERVRMDKENDGRIRILHAPSRQKAKGTDIIREILKELKEEGYEFEYIEVSGLPHRAVLEKMAMADIVVDQVYCDTPMAGLATEAAINGVPVVVGGYFADVYREVLPQPIAPTVYCNPEALKEKIVFLIEHKEERERIGQEEREYVENNCLATIIADKFLKILDDSYPKEWIMNPADNEYIWGAGMSKESVANEITRLINNYGPDSLCLDKNSTLYIKYLELYNATKAARG